MSDAAMLVHADAAETAKPTILYKESNSPYAEDSSAGERAGRSNSESPPPLVITDAGPDQSLFTSPRDPKEYRFDAAPYGMDYDSNLERRARGWFHQAGVPQWLARNIVREWNRTVEMGPDPERAELQAAATEQSLRRRWGGDYESRVAAAQSLVRSLNSAEVIDLLDRSGLANSEYLVLQLAALAESRDRRSPSREGKPVK